MRRSVITILFLSVSAIVRPQYEKTHGRDCSGNWPTIMAFVHMKNAGLADNANIDSSKTTTVRLASEKRGKDPPPINAKRMPGRLSVSFLLERSTKEIPGNRVRPYPIFPHQEIMDVIWKNQFLKLNMILA